MDFALALDRIAAVGYQARNVRDGASLSFSDNDLSIGYIPLMYIALCDLRGSANSLGNDGEKTL
ncbi:MAG: hypothetical protein WB782_01385 [Thermoplasmata archaeon]